MSTKTSNKDRQVMLRLTLEDYDAFKAIAVERMEGNVSMLLRSMVHDFLAASVKPKRKA